MENNSNEAESGYTGDLPSDEELAEYSAAWDDATLDAKRWFSLESVSPTHAAMLLCELHPDEITEDAAIKSSNGEIFQRLLCVFKDVAKHHSEPRALRGWLEIAKEKHLPYDHWIDEYVETLPEPTHTATPAQVATCQVPTWDLVKPQRFQGYGKPLYDLLRAAHIEKRPLPNARDVLDVWKIKPPYEVTEVMMDGLKYLDTRGDTKSADLNAIRKAIDRMSR